MSGKRDSNPRPPAWKASALSTELFPQERSFLTAKRLRQSPRTAKLSCGCGWIRTTEVERQQIYSLPHLATLEHTQFFFKKFQVSCFSRRGRLRTRATFTFSISLFQSSHFFSEPLVGFEPTTPRLQITCSGQLS